MAEPAPISIERALRSGWETARTNLRPLVGLAAVGGVLGLLQNALSAPTGRAGFLRGLLSLGISVLQVMLSMVWIRTALRLRSGHTPDLTHWNEVLPRFWSYFLTTMLLGLIVGVGLLFLIVPGVIIGLMFAFAGFAVVDRDLDPMDAFRESQRLTEGVKGQLLVFVLALMGINLLGALALGIGLLITVPVSVLAATEVYERLRARAGEPVGPWSTTPTDPGGIEAHV
jgi:hypothetical protein